MHFAVSVRVFSTNQNDLCGRYGQGRAGPEGVLHTNREHHPSVFVDIVNLDCVVDLLLCTTEEATESVNELIINGARTQVMPLILHDSHLSPLVLFDLILFDRIQALLATKTTEDVDVSAAHGDGVRVSTFVHWALIRDFISLGQVKSSIFFGWRTATGNQDVCRCESNSGRALIKLALAAIRQLFD